MPDYLYAVLGFFCALIIGLILIPLLIPVLRRLKFGQQILVQDGPSWHKKKQGTPTMGGLAFIVSTAVSFLLFGFRFYREGETLISVQAPSVAMTVLIFSVLFSMIGFADDMTKIRRKHNDGLTALQKILFQGILCVAFLLYIGIRNGFSTSLLIPVFGVVWDFSLLYYVIAILLIVGFVNAVNLTDGVDGLCTTVTLPVAAFFCVTAALIKLTDVSVLSACLLGSCIAYLVYNWYPSKIMMGDTGSFFLGSMVVGLSFALDMPLVILLVGIVYFCEALSVMIQVFYFKITHGKRLFKMTPIHHSFELSGYSERQICGLFGGCSLLACGLVLIWVFAYFA
ncbi:MAG: phospho-N-acetylmuramoyl-pentapeptide-transferase [Clostridia bacterium]|nr:phospho-N-acetylmuramoyl-pentapeptide-transferase [Clostridia bacterium]